MDDLPDQIAQKKNRGPRVSVSAEAFGTWNQKSAFQAKKIEKSAEAEK